jgi:hypothetical protein
MSFHNLPNLSAEELNNVFANCMREDSYLHDPVSISKASYKDAVVAIDNWLTNYAYLADDSLPEPAKTQLSMAQKARIFFAVVNAKMTTPAPVLEPAPAEPPVEEDPLPVEDPEPTP